MIFRFFLRKRNSKCTPPPPPPPLFPCQHGCTLLQHNNLILRTKKIKTLIFELGYCKLWISPFPPSSNTNLYILDFKRNNEIVFPCSYLKNSSTKNRILSSFSVENFVRLVCSGEQFFFTFFS